jgi:CHAT domain-containing protein
MYLSGADGAHLTAVSAVSPTTLPLRYVAHFKGLNGSSISAEYHVPPPLPETQFCFAASGRLHLKSTPESATELAADYEKARTQYEIAQSLAPVKALLENQQYAEALQLGIQGLARAEAAFGAEDPRLMGYLNAVAGGMVLLARFQEAEPLYQRSLAIVTKSYGAQSLEAGAIVQALAELNLNLARFGQAEILFRQALEIDQHNLGPDSARAAGVLTSLANLANRTGRYGEAEMLLRQALQIIDHLKQSDLGIAAPMLASLAAVLTRTGQYSEAESLQRRAMAINERLYGPMAPIVGENLSGIVQVMVATARHQDAEPLIRRALAIDERAFGTEHPRVAGDLLVLGAVLMRTDRAAEAVPVEERALDIMEKTFGTDSLRIAISLNDLALAYATVKRFDDAETLYRRALAIQERNVGADNAEVGRSLINLAGTLHARQREGEALPMYERAYLIGRISGDAELGWRSKAALMHHYRKDDPRPVLAIFYGKEAVNQLQSLRGNLSEASAQTQQTFVSTVAPVYRGLAEALISEGRLAEAQQVFAMLKESEYFDFIQRSASTDPRSTLADCTGSECAWEERYRQISQQLVKLSQEDAALGRKANRTPEEQAQKDRDDADLKVARSAFDAIEVSIASAASTPAERNERYRELRASTVSLQSTVGKLGHGAVLAQYVIMDDRVHILLTTPDAIIARETVIPRAELNAKIFAFRSVLSTPLGDPLPQAQALYQRLIGPIADDLKQAGAKTLMLSLDDTLRYLPFAALNDGEHYLIEDYAVDVINEAVRGRIAEAPNPNWSVWGLGVTQAHEGFKPLQGVQQELGGIVGPQGIEGQVKLDGQFTERSLHEGLDQDFPVIHIASHFQFVPGDAAKSFLLLGDGTHLSLADIKTGVEFGNVELLTLSACETAIGGGADSHGMEVEGLGEVAQEQGAKAVLASLWPVADKSTALLMRSLYHLHQQNHLTKAEALQQAQLALLHGSAATGADGDVDRGAHSLGASAPTIGTFKADPAAPFAHPYFWAPFILMGNWL